MNKFLIVFFSIVFINCGDQDQKVVANIISSLEPKSTYIGKSSELYFFKHEAISGTPYTSSFSSSSTVKAFKVEDKSPQIVFDTTLFSSNSYSDIKFKSIITDTLNSKLALLFEQCPDGEDACKPVVVTLEN